jgi:succinate dehydrogenase flavin-adding protein (antitoxin of CptAB toxin-antitoxin module)
MDILEMDFERILGVPFFTAYYCHHNQNSNTYNHFLKQGDTQILLMILQLHKPFEKVVDDKATGFNDRNWLNSSQGRAL